ncbi:MAG: hypothetical protein RR533_08150, partial [Carnobacterium sp.]
AESITVYKANSEQVIEVRVVKNAKLRDVKKNPLVQSLETGNEKDSSNDSDKITEGENASTNEIVDQSGSIEEAEHLVPTE